MSRKATRSKSRSGDDPKSNRTRERILDAAAHVLSKKGYAGARLSDIAVEARLQAPAIYYYWPSREQLIEEVMWVGIQRLHQHVADTLEALPADTSPMDRIATAIEAHLQVALELSDFATAIIRNSGQIPEEIRARQSSEDAKYGTLWRGLIQAADEAGEIRADLDRRTAQRLVIGALNWAAEWWNPERDSIEVTVRTAQSLVRHGLSSRSRLTGPPADA
ncbi:TetR/AcrR family transcriptional regulator [Streptomyces sp. NPDC004609]|uniref:TetR/AcrR family transcriptional regulator n=1 Tax=Streptomyces sp. NPDC004609 TaxID=3364704 RepID=UPI00367BD0E6